MQSFDLIEFIKIIILSIVQGITEWLPISSTGHMLLINDFMPLLLRKEFVELFIVIVQLGSIMAVMVLYFNKLNPFSHQKTAQENKDTWILWSKVAIASIPAFIFGFILDDYMDTYFNKPLVIALALIVYGIGFIVIENNHNDKHSTHINHLDNISYLTAFKYGLFQALSIIPGTSRSGSTIMGGLLLGSSRTVATEFSFFMSLPVMFGASLLKLLKLGFGMTTIELIYMLGGMTIAFIVSIIAIKFLLSYIKQNDFKAFGYYRIILGVIVIAYTLFK